MAEKQVIIGLMCGAALDGIDAALLTTDGEMLVEAGQSVVQPLEEDLRAALKEAIEKARSLSADDDLAAILGETQRDFTLACSSAVTALLEKANIIATDIDAIGLSGLTLLHHAPTPKGPGFHLQIADAQLLATETGIDVVSDFHAADMDAGGHGAPLSALYHQALVETIDPEICDPKRSVMVVNIGSVTSVTYVPRGGRGPLMAFETGPGTFLMDEWMQRGANEPFDHYGDAAGRGLSDPDALGAFLGHRHCDQVPPKSVDLSEFGLDLLDGFHLDKGAATLCAFAAASISLADHHTPDAPTTWIICGGGRRNNTLMKAMQEWIPANVFSADDIDWQGDVIEAQAMAYLAARHMRDLPITLPTTTGVAEPISGGVLYKAAALN